MLRQLTGAAPYGTIGLDGANSSLRCRACQTTGEETKRKGITKTSLFPAEKEDVFRRLQSLRTLQYIAAPFASFSPLNGNPDLLWRKGGECMFHLKLFGFLPLGIHTIRVVELDAASCQILTNEANTHVPIWNHRIWLESTPTGESRYTDEVELFAGWKTPFVSVWAKLFYRHRQKKWRKPLLRSKQATG